MQFFETLQVFNEPPARFSPAAPLWTDPYIAQQMLKAHLNPNHDLASRRPQIIDATVKRIIELTGLQAGDTLLDLGCGPGLYTRRFCEAGIRTTGIDYSENSIAYARENDPGTTYRCANYLELNTGEVYDVITLIYGDFCVLSDADRSHLLGWIRQALNPEGSSYFIMDVTTPTAHLWLKDYVNWAFYPDGGFWRPGPHLALEKGYVYSETDTFLHQYHIIEADLSSTTYHNWFHDYTPTTIIPLLNDHGFDVLMTTPDLVAGDKNEDGKWCWVLAT